MICHNCGHSHQSKYPENYPHPDTVCPKYPAECTCIAFVEKQTIAEAMKPMICRRCGLKYTGDNVFHQAECLSQWVEI